MFSTQNHVESTFVNLLFQMSSNDLVQVDDLRGSSTSSFDHPESSATKTDPGILHF